MTIGAAGLALAAAAVSPACADISDQVRKACEAKADQVRPALRTPEREAFIANCLAYATATQGQKKTLGSGHSFARYTAQSAPKRLPCAGPAYDVSGSWSSGSKGLAVP
jgi:hypothetical protein